MMQQRGFEGRVFSGKEFCNFKVDTKCNVADDPTRNVELRPRSDPSSWLIPDFCPSYSVCGGGAAYWKGPRMCWEVFAGAGLLSKAFSEKGWLAAPPLEKTYEA